MSIETDYPLETGVPQIETRGRPPSKEHVRLLTMKVGESFFSEKRREALYQLARSIGVKVRVMPATYEGIEGNRVWKKNGKERNDRVLTWVRIPRDKQKGPRKRAKEAKTQPV
jgi:hypothetical protein